MKGFKISYGNHHRQLNMFGTIIFAPITGLLLAFLFLISIPFGYKINKEENEKDNLNINLKINDDRYIYFTEDGPKEGNTGTFSGKMWKIVSHNEVTITFNNFCVG